MKRSAILRLGVGLAAAPAAAALAACGGAGGGLQSPAKPSAPVELEYWHTNPETTPLEQGRVASLKAAQAANPDHFRIRFMEPAGANMTKVIAASAAGTPPNLKSDYPYNAAQLANKRALVDYDQLLKSDAAWQKAKTVIPPSFQEGVKWLGRMVAVPLQVGQQAMMYAPDKLEKTGVKPPAANWTWADFEEISRRAARPPDVWGMSVGWRSSTWQLFSGSNGVRWINKEQTKISLSQPENLAGVEFLSRYAFGLGLMPLNSDQKTAGELLIKSQTVFEPNGPARVPELRKVGITRLEATLWPRGPKNPTPYNWGTLWSTMVFKNADPAKERAALHAAVASLTDEAQTANSIAYFGLPVTKTAKDSPSYQRFLASEPVLKQFIDMFPSCDVWPAVPSGGDMRDILDVTMADLYAQKVAIKDAFAEAERKLQRIHDDYLAQSKA